MSEVEKTWITKSGYRAVCVFMQHGYRCGYVAVPKNHPLFGIAYGATHPSASMYFEQIRNQPIGKRGVIPLVCWDPSTPPPIDVVFNVHGSITYAGGDGKYPIPGDDLWWFGFDCAHDNDQTLGTQCRNGVFRTLNYVIEECESLAKQLQCVAIINEETEKCQTTE